MSESNKGLDDFTNTRKYEDTAILEQRKDELLIFLMEKGTSFPSEMSKHLCLSMEGVNQIISHWAKIGFVEHVFPHPSEPQEIFRGRMVELWAMGVDSYEKFNMRSWWTINLAGIEYLKTKHAGKNLIIKGSLLMKYNLSEEVTKNI